MVRKENARLLKVNPRKAVIWCSIWCVVCCEWNYDHWTHCFFMSRQIHVDVLRTAWHHYLNTFLITRETISFLSRILHQLTWKILRPMCFLRDCTVWRKKNACFSNNCNFVYFQYKKIMSTPKQPVINVVLITYIDYSFTENYIGKMASFLPYTRPEPLLKVLHHIY